MRVSFVSGIGIAKLVISDVDIIPRFMETVKRLLEFR